MRGKQMMGMNRFKEIMLRRGCEYETEQVMLRRVKVRVNKQGLKGEGSKVRVNRWL